jgi:hypothetical protein
MRCRDHGRGVRLETLDAAHPIEPPGSWAIAEKHSR